MSLLKKSQIRKIKFVVVRVFDKFFTKRQNQVLFIVKKNTSFSSNHRVVCEFLIRNTQGLKIAILAEDGVPSNIKSELQKHRIRIFDGSSIPYFHFLWTSKTLLISHSVRDAYLDQSHPKRTIINYWHGASFKKIELLMNNIDPHKKKLIQHNSTLYDYMISSGKNDQEIISQSFQMDKECVLPIGLPRYDLLQDYESLFLYDNSFFHTEQFSGKRVIMYAPTFREKKASALSDLTAETLIRLERYMREHESILLIRPHSYDKFQLDLSPYKHIHSAGHDDFVETNTLLNSVDFLIVDYSSIWVDYLIKDRPIIFYQPDSAHYNDSERGLNYSGEKLPGPVVTTLDTLIEAITSIATHDSHEKNRQHFRAIFHDYEPPKASFTAELFDSIPELKALIENH